MLLMSWFILPWRYISQNTWWCQKKKKTSIEKYRNMSYNAVLCWCWYQPITLNQKKNFPPKTFFFLFFFTSLSAPIDPRTHCDSHSSSIYIHTHHYDCRPKPSHQVHFPRCCQFSRASSPPPPAHSTWFPRTSSRQPLSRSSRPTALRPGLSRRNPEARPSRVSELCRETLSSSPSHMLPST